MKYKVGQVFYLVGLETAKVIPFRVVEEITRTTMNGQEKTYVAELPDEKHTQIEVSKLKGATFDNLSSLKKHMLDNAGRAIESMIRSAEELAMAAYAAPDNDESQKPAAAEPAEVKSIPAPNKDFAVLEKNDIEHKDNSVQEDEKSDIVKVDIGNGVMANMKIKDLEKVSQI